MSTNKSSNESWEEIYSCSRILNVDFMPDKFSNNIPIGKIRQASLNIKLQYIRFGNDSKRRCKRHWQRFLTPMPELTLASENKAYKCGGVYEARHLDVGRLVRTRFDRRSWCEKSDADSCLTTATPNSPKLDCWGRWWAGCVWHTHTIVWGHWEDTEGRLK